jgi:tetratricopeptide (TPR) repeat protein
MNNPQMEKLQQLLAANNLQGAAEVCRSAIDRNGSDVNMVALLGAVLLKDGQLDEAERRLRDAIRLAPKFAKAYDDLGVLLLRRDDFQEAELMFRKAVELLPDVASSWFGLVHALKGQDSLAEAKHICGKILDANPDDQNAVRLMAGLVAEDGSVSEAGRLLQSAVDKFPDSIKAVTDLASFCAERHQYSEAIEMYKRAVELDPGNSEYQFFLGRYLSTVGHSSDALSAYDAGLELHSKSPEGRSGRLYALRAVGRSEEVVEGYRGCIEEGVNTGESWWALSSLRTYTFSDDDLDKMTALREVDDISDSDSQYLDFALGKALDDRHRYDEAWQYYTSGNEARRKLVFFDGVQFERKIDSIITAIDETAISRSNNVEPPATTPIFIVGMPRSGSTLIEQILASHSDVEATTELPYITDLAGRAIFSESEAPHAAIAGLSTGDLADIGNQYMKATKMHRGLSKPNFIDKMPENFLYLGLIAMTLPNARIIDARRNPIDTCIGNYRQWFATGKEYSYDLDELGDFYLQYCRIMQYWNDIMPGRILRVDYENVVVDTEKEVRRILEWCELPWDDNCLRFYESDRAVTTASSEQVRQPVYKSAVGFWKHYEPHLEQLREILGSVTD